MDKIYRAYAFLSRYQKILFAALIIFAVLFSVNVLFRGAIGEPYRTDAAVFVRAAQAVDAGTDIYDAKTERHWNYVYLPLLSILLWPFAHLPLWCAVMLIYWLSAAMLAGTVFWGARLEAQPAPVWRPAVLALIFTLPVMLNTMARGQMGILSLFFAVLCFVLYRRNQHLAAGFLLGFAIVLKISPVFFLLGFFLIERAWKVLAGAALAFAIFILLFPAAAVGWEKNLQYLQTWFEAMSLATSQQAQQSQLWAQLLDPYAEDNQSFYSVMMRLWGPERGEFTAGADQAVRLASRGLSLLLIGALGSVMLYRQSKGSRRGLFLEYSLFPMLMLYASPVSEGHHYTVLYLPVLAALLILQTPRKSPAFPWIQAAMGAAVLGLLLGMIFDPLNHAGAFVWSSLVLWLALLSVHALRIHKETKGAGISTSLEPV